MCHSEVPDFRRWGHDMERDVVLAELAEMYDEKNTEMIDTVVQYIPGVLIHLTTERILYNRSHLASAQGGVRG